MIELDLFIENIQSFSMYAELILLSKSMITCNHDAKFEFSNVSIVTMTGLKFVECSGSKVESVGQFVLESSRFDSGVEVYTTILAIVDTISSLDRVIFARIIIAQQPQNHTTQLHIAGAVILSNRSVITITQSWFTENNGRVLYAKHSSVIIPLLQGT